MGIDLVSYSCSKTDSLQKSK